MLEDLRGGPDPGGDRAGGKQRNRGGAGPGGDAGRQVGRRPGGRGRREHRRPRTEAAETGAVMPTTSEEQTGEGAKGKGMRWERSGV